MLYGGGDVIEEVVEGGEGFGEGDGDGSWWWLIGH